MSWSYRVCWREKEKKGGSGGNLPGLYNRSDALEISRHLREHYPGLLFWIGFIKSIPITKRDLI